MVIYLRMLWALMKHKWFMLIAGARTGVPLWRRIIHDWSKFTPAEFIPYAKWHFGGSKDRQSWASAWHHHQRLNDHHPEHWLLSWRGDPTFYDCIATKVSQEKNIVVLPMTEVAVREMLADFMAASRAYEGSWDITSWLNREGRKLILHRESVRLIAVVMYEMGYMLTDNCDWSWLAPRSWQKN